MFTTTTVKTSGLSGVALDWAVAKCEDKSCMKALKANPNWVNSLDYWEYFKYSANWNLGGPIIEREKIRVSFVNTPEASPDFDKPDWGQRFYGKTYLEAAMRCYVASKLGESVEIPTELLK